ncbi:MAG: hypothetical protein ACOCUT_00700 [bacterium]
MTTSFKLDGIGNPEGFVGMIRDKYPDSNVVFSYNKLNNAIEVDVNERVPLQLQLGIKSRIADEIKNFKEKKWGDVH